MLSNFQTNQLRKFFQSSSQIKLAYIFGSQAQGTSGPLSDYDFAFYLGGADKESKQKLFDFKLYLISRLRQILKSDKIDVVILNMVKSPELAYNIIKEGKLLFEREPYRLLVEPQILNKYFDFHYLLSKYNLTKA